MSERITSAVEEISLQANDFEKLNVDLDAVRNIEQIIYEFKSAYKESNPTEAEYKNTIEDIFRKVKDISDKVRDFEISLPAEGDKITTEELAELFANLDSWSTDLKEHAHQIQEATIAYNERVSALESQNADVDAEAIPESDETVAPVSAENDEAAKSGGDSTATASTPAPAPAAPAPSPAPAPKTTPVKKTVDSTKDKEVPEVNIEQLNGQLLGGDLAFYKNANGKYKNKAELGKAFGDVFRYQNVAQALGDEFFDNQFEHIFPQIDRARTSKEFDIVNELRELMLEKALEVIAADQVADISVDNEASLERGVSEVEADVIAQKERLADLEKRFGHDATFASSDNYKIAKERIDQIDSVQTSDPNSASKQKDKYLSSLEEALDKLTLETAALAEPGGVLSDPEPAPLSTAPSIEKVKNLESREKVKAEFLAFATENKEKITEALAVHTIDDFLYENFYSENKSARKYNSKVDGYDNLVAEYNSATNTLRESLNERAANSAGAVELYPNTYWVNANLLAEAATKQVGGRIYVNTNPSNTHEVFLQLLDSSISGKIFCQVKMPADANEHSLNRADKIVYYFDPSDESEVLEMIEGVYKNNPNAFEESAPKFTAELIDAEGDKMTGFAFGAEPKQSYTSFGRERVSVLVSVIKEAESKGLYVDDPDFDFDSAYERACQIYNVEPGNPAFNLEQNSGEFTLLKKRLGIDTEDTKTPQSLSEVTPLPLDSGEVTPWPISNADDGLVTPWPLVDDQDGLVTPMPLDDENVSTKNENPITPEPVPTPTPTPTPAPIPTSPEAAPKDPALVERYKNARGVWREASEAHRVKEAEYQAALKDFYNGDNWKAKLRVGLFSAASAIGLKPNLPPAVAALEAEYKSTRQAYAEALAVVLAGRGELGNVGLGEDPAKAKIAFADKYIINPQQELLKLQEYSLLRPETREKVQKTMGFLAKHKWHTRVGMVAAAGVVGGLTGGVGLAAAGASWQVWKMAAGTVASLGAAKLAKMATDRRVEMANVEAGINTRDTRQNFNLDDLDSLASGYARTQKEVKDAEKFQKKAVFGAAIAAGGATGIALGQVPEGFVSVSSEDVVVSPFARDIALPYSGREGGFEHVISDLNLGEDFNASALTSEQTAQIESFLRVKITDYLDANVNMSEAKLEQNLYGVLERKFGNEPWWLEANIRKVDIGEIVLRPVGAAIPAEAPLNVMPNLSPLDNDVTPSTEVVSGEVYEVVKGDTLGEIMLDKFKLQFSGFDSAEKQELLNRVFAKLENDPELVKQLGLRSGDIDLIYPGEKINMSLLNDLIDREGERMAILENFQKSAPLPVEVEADVKNVPITVVERPVVAPSEVNFEGRTYTEATPAEVARVPEKPAVPVAPKITPLNGQYLDHPAYKNYLTQVFGSEDQALREVLKSAKAFDASTYDVFDGMKGYESPYTLLGDMKMKDYVEFTKQSPVEIRAFLTENNIKYETYLAWVGKINELRSSLPATGETKIGDLFSREVALEAAKKLQK